MGSSTHQPYFGLYEVSWELFWDKLKETHFYTKALRQRLFQHLQSCSAGRSKISHVDNNKWKDFPLARLLETALLGAYALYSSECKTSSWIRSLAMYSWPWFSPNLTGAPTQPALHEAKRAAPASAVGLNGVSRAGWGGEGGNPHLHYHHTV